MKKNSKELIAYASAFVSFVLPKIDVDEIILFGSVAREEASTHSDLDLFFNTRQNPDKIKEIAKHELGNFYKSDLYKKWQIRTLALPIKIEVGDLNEWKLKRSIVSEGLVLYGKYKTLPDKLRSYVYFSIKPVKNIAKRNRIIRHLFGRKEKNYSSIGVLSALGTKQLSPLSFIIPSEKSPDIIKYLQSEKLDFTFFELWSDSLN